MATTFLGKPSGNKVAVIARVQRTSPKVNLKQSTGITVSPESWDKLKTYLAHLSAKDCDLLAALRAAKRDGIDTDKLNKLQSIREKLDEESLAGLSAEAMRDTIDEIVNAELYAIRKQQEEERKQREAKQREEEEQRNRITFMQYYADFLKGIDTDKGRKKPKIVSKNETAFAERSQINYNQGYNKLTKYQKDRKTVVDWDDIDLVFLDDYKAFLRSEGYSINTISKRVTEIKHLVHKAHDEGITTSTIYDNSSFHVKEDDRTDSIYLTDDDLAAIKAVDLTELPNSYRWSRDLFLIGCYTAQRISDYNHLKPENIRTEVEKVIVEGKDGDRIEKVERKYICIRQAKTGADVIIPCKAELREILERYPNGLPKVCDQVLNRRIKKIAEMAGLDEMVTIRSTKGGKEKNEQYPKYELVHSHTARRTGATLMYLAGVEAHDICRITGHASIKMLNKYIKAGSLEAAKKFSTKYDYFK